MALINLRNALVAGKRLPYDAEVEYLESTGTQWINTGVYWSLGDSLKIVTAQTQVVDQAAFGVAGKIYGFSSGFGGNSSRTFYWGNAPYSGGGFYVLPTEYGTAIHTITIGTDYCDVDGTSVAATSSAADTSDSLHTVVLFGRADNTATTRLNKTYNGRIYSFQYWKNGVLVRDYIPVRKGTVGYLYDRVSGKLFGNAGTGDFVLGQDVVPVEYIESTGAQYIVTPKILNSSTEEDAYIEVDVRPQAQAQAQYGVIYSQGSSVFKSPFSILANRGASTTTAFFTGMGEVAVSTTGDRIKVGVKHKTRNSWDIFADGTNVGSKYMSGSYAFGETSFGAFNAGASKVASGTRFYSVSSSAYNLRPVRVGTDATSWEGAMMDVLTRRIYRNQGTGAFTYGNDLKYPIPAE